MIADYVDNTQKMCVLYRVHHLCIWPAIKTVPAAPAKFVFIVWTTEQWDENMLHHEAAGHMEL